MSEISDIGILEAGREECERVARKLKRISEVEAFLESFRMLQTEAMILDDSCLEDKGRATELLGE